MKKLVYEKPIMDSISEEQLREMIISGASCPNCYNGCNYYCW